MKPDRRVQRTRMLLQESLVDLIIECGYENITVQDILERANCGRSTFYTHFSNKEDLLLGGFEAFNDALPDSIFPLPQDVTTYVDFGHALFLHVEENKQLARAMFGSHVWSVVSNHLRNTLLIYARKWIERYVKPEEKLVPAEALAQYITSALLGLLMWWVGQDFPYTADKMNAMLSRLILPGLDNIY